MSRQRATAPRGARERTRARRIVAALSAVVALVGSLSLTARPALASACVETTVTPPIVADTWLDEGSPSSAKGSDAVLSVDAGSANVDSGVPSGRNRTLVRFATPAAPPPGCVVAAATLVLHSVEESEGAKVAVIPVASAWSEPGATWDSQPGTTGGAATSWSREGPMHWNVTTQVTAMLAGTDHGFFVRDAAEGTEAGGEHAFLSREKGDSDGEPELVIRFAAPGSDGPSEPPAPPAPATVHCGQVLTRSTLVTNDLSGCPGDGLVIGAPRIIVDLGGRTITGVGLGSGLANPGHASVVIRNGTVSGFDHGIQLHPETTLNVVEGLTLRANQIAAIELFDVSASQIRANALDGNGGGILLVSGTRATVVSDNTMTATGGAGLLLRDASGNRLERNHVGDGGDLGIGLERSTGNTLVGNTASTNSDGGIELGEASHGNRIEGNTVTGSGDHGILISDSDRNELIGNVSHLMSDSGITLDAANDGVVRGNDVRFNTGGLQLDGSSRNRIEANNASDTTGIGIELGDGAVTNVVEGNTASRNGAQGIYVAADVVDALGNPVPSEGNVVRANTAVGNRADGIVTAKAGHTITANVTSGNAGYGIKAAPGSVDGGGNVASDGQACTGVVCRADWEPPQTNIGTGPTGRTNRTTASFTFSAPEAGVTFACALDAGAFVACTSPHQYTGLRAGAHTFRVRATDGFGNTDASPASWSWTIDTTAPNTTITSGPPRTTRIRTATVRFSASESGARFQCSLNGAAYTTCTSPRTWRNLSVRTYTLRVRAIDAVGNVDPTPATRTWTVRR